MTQFRTLALATLILGAAVSQAQSDQQPSIHVVIFGAEVQFADAQPVMSDNRVLVPLRGVFERLGAKVDWAPSTQTVTARRGRRLVVLSVGQLDASVNGRDVHLDVPATLVNGSTMVPLRFVSEAFGEVVTWNDAQHEVDINRGPDEDREVRAPRPTPPPPPREVVRTITKYVPMPPKVPTQIIDIIPADSVLPLSLNTRLSSYDARSGDQFTATIQGNYLDLPNGSLVYGHVRFAKPHRGNDPGVIELQFDRVVTPRGVNFPLDGRLIGLDSGSVVKGPHGVLIARSSVRNDRVVFSGYGPGVGVIVGFHDSHVIADLAVGDFVRRTVSRDVQRRQTTDVELVPGTRMGFRLHRDLSVPRGLQ